MNSEIIKKAIQLFEDEKVEQNSTQVQNSPAGYSNLTLKNLIFLTILFRNPTEHS